MTDIITLLTFPKTSKAFTAFRTLVADDGSASPPHKKQRLDATSDSASAYRSRPQDTNSNDAKGPRSIKILGEPIQSTSERYVDNSLTQLKRCIRVLLTKESSDRLPLTYEGVYTTCQSLVLVSNRGDGVYETLKLELEQCVARLAKQLTASGCADDRVQWLVHFVEICSWFEKQVTLLQSLLTYLDQVYLPAKQDTPRVRALARSLFTTRVFSDAKFLDLLRTAIRQWTAWERENRAVHELRTHIKQLVAHLQVYEKYDQAFALSYIKFAESDYVAESQRLYETMKDNAREFRRQCKIRIDEEEQRMHDVLLPVSWEAVKEITEKSLLNGRLQWLAKNALAPSMDAKALDELAELYDLFSRVDGLKILCVAFKEYVQTGVKNIVKDASKDDDMVQRLLDFKNFAHTVLSTAFVDDIKEPGADQNLSVPHASTSQLRDADSVKQTNKEFGYAMVDAFNAGFKARRNKPAEMIAKYIDKVMRKGQKGASDAEFNEILDAALSLYRFTDDKDVFRTFYHRSLAKRLLLQRSASDDFEKSILKRLQQQYDPEFGMGDHMFNDRALSGDLLSEYHSKTLEDDPARKLFVTVLQRSVWPFTAPKSEVDLPPSMQEQLTKYTLFYKNKHQGRKLEWDHGLGTANLNARFKAGVKDLSVSLYQAVILLLFNESTEISFLDIKAQARMGDAELRRTLQSLACGKKRVLKKRPAGPDINDGDVFFFNADFTDPRPRVHVNSIQAKETPEESKRTHSAIEGDRKHFLDAAIVRIMKSKKQMYYEPLKTATIEAVKSHFIPDVSSIKQRIQGLLEQEYLRRDDDDMNLYVYVA